MRKGLQYLAWFTPYTPGYNETKPVHEELWTVRKGKEMIRTRKEFEEKMAPPIKRLLMWVGLGSYTSKLRKVQRIVHQKEYTILCKAQQLLLSDKSEDRRAFNDFCLGVGAVDPELEKQIERASMFWLNPFGAFTPQSNSF